MAKTQSKPKLNIVEPVSSLELLVNVCGGKKMGCVITKNNKSGGVDVVLWEDSCWGVGVRRDSDKP